MTDRPGLDAPVYPTAAHAANAGDSAGPSREMTLQEVIATLPTHHRARGEYERLTVMANENSFLAAASTRHLFFEKRVRELGLLDKDADYGGMIGKSILEISAVIATQGHSGQSMQWVRECLDRLFQEYETQPAPAMAGSAGFSSPELAQPAVANWRDERKKRQSESTIGQPARLGDFRPDPPSSNGTRSRAARELDAAFPPPDALLPRAELLAANNGLNDKLGRVRALECLRAEVNEIINRGMDAELL
jgi:hypothetical protein